MLYGSQLSTCSVPWDPSLQYVPLTAVVSAPVPSPTEPYGFMLSMR